MNRDDAVVLAVAVAVGHEDVAVRRDDDVGRLIEEIGTGAADARLAERHQHLAVGAELEDLMALAVLAARVGHPEVAVAVHGRAVREDEHALAPATRAACRSRRTSGSALPCGRRTSSRSSGGRRRSCRPAPASTAVTAAHFTPAATGPSHASCGRAAAGRCAGPPWTA